LDDIDEHRLIRDLKRLAHHVSKTRLVQFSGLAIFMLFGAVAEMVTIAAVVPFLSALLGASGTSSILPDLFSNIDLRDIAFILCIAAVTAAFIRGLLSWSTHRYTAAIGIDLSKKLYSRILSQPYEQHISRNSSDVIAGFEKINGVVSKTINPLLQGLVAIIMVLGILIVLFAIDTTVALVSILLIGALYFFVSLITRSSLTRNSNIIADSAAMCIRSIQEGLGGIRDIILDNTQGVFIKHYSSDVTSMRVAQASNAFVSESPRFIIEAAGMIMIVVIAWGVSQRGEGVQEAIPILGALALGAQKLLPAMQRIYFARSSIRGNSKNLVDILELMEQPITKPRALMELKQARSDQKLPVLRLANVAYSYSGAEKPVFIDLSIEIQKGDRIGIMGKTGSGKSTLADITMGLLQPTSGQIYVHDELLTLANRRGWQSQLAHVPQFIYLADSSIVENIAFGVNSRDIDLDLVESVIEKAQLDDVVQNLNSGINEVIGERGVKLSGGQRQRLGLARALYKKPEFLVLDEATSALDGHTERNVMEVIEALGGGITILIIAHKLSTLANCNKIIELDSFGRSIVRNVDEVLRTRLKNST
jgi:ABC-type multidrug transport system fused ATPase/permease subunit